MAQWGELTDAEKASFNSYMQRTVREPSASIWIASQGDIDTYLMGIKIDRKLESARGPGNIAIGRAEILLDNIDGTFFTDGESMIDENSRVKVWLGFKGLNIPAFTGIVRSVEPDFLQNVVTLYCADYMMLFAEDEIIGSLGAYNTIKLILDNFCDGIQAQSNVGTDSELTAILDSPFFDRQSVIHTIEELQNSIFHAAWFDESGTLQIKEREYRNHVDWTFTKDNVDRPELMASTGIINNLYYEYKENFYFLYSDQASIDTHGEHRRTSRVLVTNSQEISSKLHGLTEYEISNALEGTKIEASVDSTILDNVHLKIRQAAGSSGNIYVDLYSDVGGLPGVSLGTSVAKAVGNLSETFAWEAFRFRTPIEIEPSTDYWIVLNVNGVTGAVYGEFSSASISEQYAVYGGAWVTEDNKQLLHEARGSIEAARASEDKIRFYKDPKDKIRIIGMAIPFLQILDEVDVDIELDEGSIVGKYTILEIKSQSDLMAYDTVYTMYKTG